MSKVLMVFIVVLASYLLYDMFSSSDDSIALKETEAPEFSVEPGTSSKKNREQAVPLYEIEPGTPSETALFDAEFIDATYTAKIDNERLKANLRFSFSEDGTFSDNRDMSFPKSIAGEATGTYSIEGSAITLIYAEQRDREVFKFDNSKMSLHEDGTLRTGTVVLTKQ
tara:strand:- start:845 stop:1348 length:504 start_codon:yes stop_codon:yes gene_type:complete